jgi:hypothetical protein
LYIGDHSSQWGGCQEDDDSVKTYYEYLYIDSLGFRQTRAQAALPGGSGEDDITIYYGAICMAYGIDKGNRETRRRNRPYNSVF